MVFVGDVGDGAVSEADGVLDVFLPFVEGLGWGEFGEEDLGAEGFEEVDFVGVVYEGECVVEHSGGVSSLEVCEVVGLGDDCAEVGVEGF